MNLTILNTRKIGSAEQGLTVGRPQTCNPERPTAMKMVVEAVRWSNTFNMEVCDDRRCRMREIKFRGKRIDNGEWVYGYYFQGFTGISYILVLHDHILGITEFYEVDPETIGQYTGLKDENGTEIYEGDVCWEWIEFCKQTKPYVVEDLRKLYLETKRDDSYYRITSLQVIDNIHDNPELLGGAE